jgi:hypothetical protein
MERNYTQAEACDYDLLLVGRYPSIYNSSFVIHHRFSSTPYTLTPTPSLASSPLSYSCDRPSRPHAAFP